MEALANIFGEDKKAKKKKVYSKKLNFNVLKFPGAANLSLAIIFFAIAGGLIFLVSNLVPQLNRERVRETIIETTRSFELEDEVNGGLFSASNRKGDTAVSPYSTMMGISILKGEIKNVKGAKDFTQRLQLGGFDDNLETMNVGVRIMKELGMLEASDFASKALLDKIYNHVLTLYESGTQSGSGFRTTKFRSPTVVASYIALETIAKLGKLEEFKKTPEFSNTIQFIISQKNGGGFSDIESQNATLLSTYYAVKALLFDSSNQETIRELRDVSGFVYSCQGVDGGFSNLPLDLQNSEEDSKSSSKSTLEALHILYSLAKVGVVDNSVLSEFSGVESAASAYIRGCVKGGKGLTTSLESKQSDLRSNFRFSELNEEFPDQLDYGTVAVFKPLLIGAGVLCLLIGVNYFYKEQIIAEKSLPEDFYKEVTREISTIFVLGLSGSISLYFLPSLSLVVYLVLFSYVAMRFFEYLVNDQSQGEFFTISFISAAFHFILLALLNSTTRGTCFTNIYFYYMFALWFVLVTFFSGFLSTAISGNRKPSLYISASFSGWVLSLIATLIYVTSSDVWSTAHQLIAIRGEAPLIYFVLPFASLYLSYLAGLVAISV